ncbi:3-isopropylmalate dehydratase large subunit [Candidatus Aerophobetes bacterium]|nr:3-isopropylmalate dehydratase large subunit [Candidatus Aerophobetes bacterium]
MGKTFAEKILALKSGKESISIGEIVTVSPDAVMSHDNAAAISKKFKQIGVNKVIHPERIVIPLDHCVPAATEKYALNHKVIREFVQEQGIKNFYDINTGVCHQVLPEKGHTLPGTLVLGSDSHTTTYGAFGAFAAGIGRSEVASIWATGKIWLKVPETIKINIEGEIPKGVYPKDIILYIIGDLGADGALYKAVEFSGKVVRDMSVGGRMTLCNMAAEMGAKIGYVEPDEKSIQWLASRTEKEYKIVKSDADAEFERIIDYDISGLEPQIACPHTVDNVKPVSDVMGTKINQALIGTCTNGRIEDLKIASDILQGKKISRNVRLLVFPASMEVFAEAMEKGIFQELVKSGAVIMNPGCGPCLGAHEGVLAPGEVCLSTANRNFKGRMGCKEAKVYLASPATVAASSLYGEITDVRRCLK